MSERLHGYLGEPEPAPAPTQSSFWTSAWPAVISGSVEAVVSFLLVQWLVEQTSSRKRR